jgi:ABC-type branched-subunit amino acid transport system substrate-binding protein
MAGPVDLDHRLRSAAGPQPDTERALADVLQRVRRRTRRTVVAAVTVVAVVGALVAVWVVDGQGSDRSPVLVGVPTTRSPSETSPSNDVEVGQEPATGPPTGEAAPTCTGEEDGILRIGGLLPATGDLAFLGPPMIAAASLAVDEINAEGGVLDRPVEYQPGDSGDGAHEDYFEVANASVDAHLGAGVDAVLGAAGSGVSLNVIDRITGACKIHFSPANTTPQFTDYNDNDLYFRTSPSDELQGQVLADLIVAEGNSTVALLARQDSYGEGLLEFTKQPLEEQGADVVIARTYDPGAVAFEADAEAQAAVEDAVDAVISADPDALVLIGFDESSIILNSLFERGFTPREHGIYLTDGNIGDTLGEFVTPGQLGGVKGTQTPAEVPDEFRVRLLEIDPNVNDFSYGPETYDAVIIMALAAERAGTDNPADVAANINGITRDGTACTSFAECRDLIADGEDIDYNGPSGPQEFSQPGEPTVASFAIESYGADNRIDDSLTEFREARL